MLDRRISIKNRVRGEVKCFYLVHSYSIKRYEPSAKHFESNVKIGDCPPHRFGGGNVLPHSFVWRIVRCLLGTSFGLVGFFIVWEEIILGQFHPLRGVVSFYRFDTFSHASMVFLPEKNIERKKQRYNKPIVLNSFIFEQL